MNDLAGAGARLAIHHAGTTEELSDAVAVVRQIQAMGGEATAFGQGFVQDDAAQLLVAAVTAWASIASAWSRWTLPDERPVFGLAIAERIVANPPAPAVQGA